MLSEAGLGWGEWRGILPLPGQAQRIPRLPPLHYVRGCGGEGMEGGDASDLPRGNQVFSPLAWVNWLRHFVVGLVSVSRKRN